MRLHPARKARSICRGRRWRKREAAKARDKSTHFRAPYKKVSSIEGKGSKFTVLLPFRMPVPEGSPL